MPRKKSEHYVNNKELLEAMIVYRSKVEKSYKETFNRDLTEQPRQERGKRWEGKPPIPNYLGDCFLKIATHLSYKPNFVNYMFREDMISDGIENCVQYIHNFDPEKSKNPFAYFTQVIHFAFVRRIQKEKKQQATKYKMLENVDLNQLLVHSDGNDEYVSQVIDLMKRQMDTIEPDRKEVKK